MSQELFYSDFYSVLAEYLLKMRLVDGIDYNESRLIVHEKCSDMKFEIKLSVKCVDEDLGV